MFGVSLWELLVVLLLLVVVVGPDRLPEMARKVGRAFGQFRRSVESLKEETGLDEDLEALAELKDLPVQLLEESPPDPPAGPEETQPARKRRPRRRVDGPAGGEGR